MNPLEALMRQIADGRGLWIGLFASNGPSLGLNLGDSGIIDYHVTLAHLGRDKSRNEMTMRAMMAGVQDCASNNFAQETRIHGTARFSGGRDGDPLVYLLKGPNLHTLHASLLRHLEAYDIKVDDRFGFLPHVTVTRVTRDTEIMIKHPPNSLLTFDRISIVCGDVRIPIELAASPF